LLRPSLPRGPRHSQHRRLIIGRVLHHRLQDTHRPTCICPKHFTRRRFRRLLRTILRDHSSWVPECTKHDFWCAWNIASLKRLEQLSSRLHSPTTPVNERLRSCKRCEREVARGEGRLRSKDAACRSLSANGYWTLGIVESISLGLLLRPSSQAKESEGLVTTKDCGKLP